MEVDEGDVSAELLEQLHSLQTVDHDDLVSQMLRLVGSDSLTVDTAKFYLDMNGWNVQAAVCSYFDLESGPPPPKMTFVKDVTIGEGESVPPDTQFIKTWKVQNTGGDTWPPGCMLVHTHGHVLTAPPSPTRVPVEPLMSYQIRDLSLPMRSPATPGIYESKWRMSTASGLFFGDTIWVIITVERAGTLALTQQMDSFEFQSPEEQQQQQQQQQQPPRNPFSPKKTG